jgi:NAD(P)-dependent dehydrogenase (short-subunit alcohol dehydrogenase family)
MYRELTDLSSKTAVVLGAKGGIGSRITRGLLEWGATVVAVSRDKSACEASFEAERKEFGDRLVCLQAEASEDSSLRNLLSECVAKFKSIDIMVNCVGGNMKEATTDPERTFFDLDTEAVKKVVELNLIAGAVLPAKVFGKEMAKNAQGGSMILVSSMSADRPLTRVPGYGAAKAAVENFTKWLAVDLCKNHNKQLRVNAVAPGFFHTKQNDFLLYSADRTLTPRGQDIIDGTPMARFGKLEETVGAVLWLASDLSQFVTGTVIPVDGGFSAFSGV